KAFIGKAEPGKPAIITGFLMVRQSVRALYRSIFISPANHVNHIDFQTPAPPDPCLKLTLQT
ncbi:MAG: hypothetical protein ABI656_06850, partial [bacterium]